MIDEVMLEAESEMDSSIDAFKNELSRIRTGRAHAGMLDHVHVDYYGAPTPLRSLANVSVQEGRTLLIQPFDKSTLKVIEQGLAATSGLSVPVQNDGTNLRMTLPELTTESRKHHVKEMRKKGEDAKIRIRGARRDANDGAKKLEKGKKITEDDLKRAESDIQELTDKYTAKVDELMDNKEKDIMEI
jgi:ribosome recycling factor